MAKESHKGSVQLNHSFDEAFDYLIQNDLGELKTARNTVFKARALETSASETDNKQKVIKFSQKVGGKEKDYARCFACCWSHSNNCDGTWIGMYCKSLDQAIR